MMRFSLAVLLILFSCMSFAKREMQVTKNALSVALKADVQVASETQITGLTDVYINPDTPDKTAYVSACIYTNARSGLYRLTLTGSANQFLLTLNGNSDLGNSIPYSVNFYPYKGQEYIADTGRQYNPDEVYALNHNMPSIPFNVIATTPYCSYDEKSQFAITVNHDNQAALPLMPGLYVSQLTIEVDAI